ncbi:phosphodiester glycosidase family protein [Veillonella caviae]|uniref:phosphodiester glycosidase family protein n=1 Tax=Veillonella caviae TaxID=248316 RepID=UPI0023A90529|nr:phosphodiester glycosidase family protein [Veillonella caviae]MCI5708989.1 phosphodiester glycosidase family protein [Veillonella caviae]MCI6407700.1 phosphodiester glycosidase family protein [Veillonella caviae]MCI7693229.1 phosphodiester glycosidase family protein [Veillonella caviae]MDD7290890.1 phosphodiester glycosidase family protein [Veillonella caviae]MDY4746899.1 phosphodiester glycosidase family protein [Veillonella caviae]
MFKKNWVKFIIMVFLFTVVTSPLVVLFGPFNNVKRAVIGAILQSRHPQYITWLFSPDELQNILGTVGAVKSQDLFKFNAREDQSLNLERIESPRYIGYILEIPDPRRIQVATAANIQEKGDTTSNIAKMNGAVAAINGGGFHDPNGTGTGRLPYGFILHDGEYIIGKDVGPDEDVDFVGFSKSGNLIAGNYDKTELGDMNAMEGITFGPPLIVDGKKMITEGDGGWGVGPRTAIGQRKDGTVLFLVIDGRQPGYSLGATLRDVQDVLYEKGAYIAANLDGGSSSTLYLNGKVVNKPADLLGERMIPTAFIVK